MTFAIRRPLVGSLLLLCAGSPAAATVTFNSASVAGTTYVSVGGVEQQQIVSDPTTSLQYAAFLQASKTLTVNTGQGRATAVARIAAVLNDATSGSVGFLNLHAQAMSASAAASVAFQYVFTLDSASSLALTYDTPVVTQNFDGSYPGAKFTVLDSTNQSIFDYNVISGSGNIGTTIGAGTYTLIIASSPGVSQQSTSSSLRQTSFVGDYSFAFTDSVPEPATWLTMIVGFGAIGTMMRRRNSGFAASA